MARLIGLLVAALALAGCATTSPGAGARFRDCPDCPEMIVVPAGAFEMGAEGGEPGRPEGPVRTVTIGRPFALAKLETTNAEWARFVAETGTGEGGGCSVFPAQPDVDAARFSWRDPGYGRPPAPDEPVACITWTEATAFVRWLSARAGKPYRLPTEAEWEYAARAGAQTAFPWGDAADAGCAYANLYDAAGAREKLFSWASAACDDGFARVAPVGSKKANAFGLHDMVGNVWEWLADCYVAPYPATPVDGRAVEVAGECPRRAVRGGSWITRPDRNRPAWRGRDPVDTRFSMFGLRVARDLPSTEDRR
jgi:formylglycine-generating enzyme required for sulfatase activity